MLKPGGQVALLWNSRRRDSDFTQATADVFRRHISDFPGFSGDHKVSAEEFDEFFEPDGFEYREFAHDQMLTVDEFLGRNLSATYAPREGDPAYAPLVADLRRLFDDHREDDVVRFPLTTRLFWAAWGSDRLTALPGDDAGRLCWVRRWGTGSDDRTADKCSKSQRSGP